MFKSFHIRRSRENYGADSTGGYTVPAPCWQAFSTACARALVMVSGAVIVPMAAATLPIAKSTGGPTATWHAENVQEIDSDMTFGNAQPEVRILPALVRAWHEVIEDSANAEQALEAAFAGALSVERDSAALFWAHGDGPKGILGVTGVYNVDMATDGAPPTNVPEILDLSRLILDHNVEPATGAIVVPGTMIQHLYRARRC